MLHLIHRARPHLVHSDAPAMVVINGVTAHAPDPTWRGEHRRAAVVNLVHLLALRVAGERGRVNLVNLGAIATERQR